ncbi:MAG: hypothetical protein COY49_00700 [Comamonadaceae bacterium CG_4_10_14_0_8_um_filter_57_29]|nr:MAG: hypothetical protein COY49_00700 [Comamonadaceae bacterium CG_4_10_14_0_8_um_filter_57_29]
MGLDCNALICNALACAGFWVLGLTRAAAAFGGLLILEYQKSSAAKASHCAGGSCDLQPKATAPVHKNGFREFGLLALS